MERLIPERMLASSIYSLNCSLLSSKGLDQPKVQSREVSAPAAEIVSISYNTLTVACKMAQWPVSSTTIIYQFFTILLVLGD